MWRIRLAVLAYACTIVGWTSFGINDGWLYGADIIDQTINGVLQGLVIGIIPGGLAGIIGVAYDDNEEEE